MNINVYIASCYAAYLMYVDTRQNLQYMIEIFEKIQNNSVLQSQAKLLVFNLMKIMNVTTEIAESLIDQLLERISDSTGLNISVKSI